MYLQHLKLENFRGLREFDLELAPGLNVIVGENNIGKSAILDAIRMVLAPGATGGDRIYAIKDDLHRNTSDEISTKFSAHLTFADLSELDQALFIPGLNFDFDDPNKSTFSIHYEWSWNENAQRYSWTRWFGKRQKTQATIPDECLQYIRWTYLDALRDASRSLAPNRYSRLAKLLTALADNESRQEIEAIFAAANNGLRDNTGLIENAERHIQQRLSGASGNILTQKARIATAKPEFDRIISTLRLQFGDSNITGFRDLHENGLGYNNLLYIATVLAELETAREDSCRLLLIEEPEAHLHPQLQVVLANHLAQLGRDELPASDHEQDAPVQVIMTSHSPTIASRVEPYQLRVIHRRQKNSAIYSACLEHLMDDVPKMKKLQRMLDITKATLLFARGVILVEGLAEQLLLPVLAKHCGYDLEHSAVAIVPVNGVDFETFIQLFGSEPNQIDIPVAVITDGDPPRVLEENGELIRDNDGKPKHWSKASERRNARPMKNGTEFARCERVIALEEQLRETRLELCLSDVTLEYDLAATSEANAILMAEAWSNAYYSSSPRKFTAEELKKYSTRDEKALFVWQEICLSSSNVGKGQFAQELALLLDEAVTKSSASFEVPGYIRKAFEHVLNGVEQDLLEEASEVSHV